MKSLVLIGSGPSAHILSNLLTREDNRNSWDVVILTRQSDIVKRWMGSTIVNLPDGSRYEGKKPTVTTDVRTALEDASIVIYTGPVFALEENLNRISSFIKEKTVFGCIFAQGNAHLAIQKYLPNNDYFIMRNIPWTCSIDIKCVMSTLHATKKYVEIATKGISASMLKNIEQIVAAPVQDNQGIWSNGPKLNRVTDFTSILLNNSVGILFPAVYYELWTTWDGSPVPANTIPKNLFSQVGITASRLITSIDSFILELKQQINSLENNTKKSSSLQYIVPIKERLLSQYENVITDKSSLEAILRTNEAYSSVLTPVTAVENNMVLPAGNNEFLKDSIGHCLVPLLNLAQIFGLHEHEGAMVISALIYFWQPVIGKKYLEDKGNCGKLCGEDISDIQLLPLKGDIIQLLNLK